MGVWPGVASPWPDLYIELPSLLPVRRYVREIITLALLRQIRKSTFRFKITAAKSRIRHLSHSKAILCATLCYQQQGVKRR